MYGMATAWGQMFVGFFITLIFLKPVFHVNEYFAQTLPIGFAGGHGTAAALSDVFRDVGFENGSDISLATATVGLFMTNSKGFLERYSIGSYYFNLAWQVTGFHTI